VLEDLLDSDAAYFEAGAVIEQVLGASIVRMEGLGLLPASCVVQRIEESALPDDIDGWLRSLETRLAGYDISQSRLYVRKEAPRLETALARNGYRPRDESAVVLAAAPVDDSEDITLRVIDDEQSWAEKLSLQKSMEITPDGHRSPSELWVDMERRKCDSGFMKPYLIEENGEVVGTTNAALWGSVLRLKNLAVHPDHRLRGIGSDTITLFARIAAESNKLAVGAFVLANEPFAGMYPNRGYETVGKQTEWMKEHQL